MGNRNNFINGRLSKFFLIVNVLIVISCNQNIRTDKTENIPFSEIGVALYSFNRFSFPETLTKARESGTELVEGFFFHQLGDDFQNKSILDLSDEEVKRMKLLIDQEGMHMPSIYAGGKDVEEWKRFFEIGRILELDFLVAEPEPEYWDLLDSLGQANSIKIAIHEHARGKSRFWHPDSVLVAVEGRPSFGACGDLGHWVRSGLDPVECLARLEGHLISIHAKDLDEFGNIEANDVKVSAGVIDYAGVMEELDRQGFSGPIYVECEHDWEDNLDDVKYAVEYLKKRRNKTNQR